MRARGANQGAVGPIGEAVKLLEASVARDPVFAPA